MLQHVVFVYLANTTVSFYSLAMICCCQVQNYIYWIISTENDHRHHHKFIKYEERLRKEGNILGLPINNNQPLPWVRSIQRQRSNWSPTYILHLFHLEDTSLLFLFISESVKVAFFHALTVSLLPENHMLFIVSKQCACSRRVHIEDHMNRFEYCHPDNNSDNDSFGSFSYLLQHNSVLIFILWRWVRKSTIILGMKKLRSW
jgi:hypothetical protein